MPTGTIDRFVDVSRTVTLREHMEGDRRIYGEACRVGAFGGDVAPLRPRRCTLCACWPWEAVTRHRFHAGQGSELLTFLARIMEHCIRTWLDLPR